MTLMSPPPSTPWLPLRQSIHGLAHLFMCRAELRQHLGADPIRIGDQREEQVLRPHAMGLWRSEHDRIAHESLYSWRDGDLRDVGLFGRNSLENACARELERDSELLQGALGDAVRTEQGDHHVLGPD